ncbi:MAG: flagellar M-ring protein FliF [Clostridiales bacterium]|nr:flagellar M-ring protein FliF [Clostridiales bacterium]
MKNILGNVVKSLKNFFAKMTKAEKIRLGVIAAAIIILSVVISVYLGRVEYAVLYSGLDASEAGQILAALEDMGVSAKTQGTDTILVPEQRVSELRMKLSAEGYQSGDFDYSIFQNASGFGMTDLEKQTYLQFQIQANLRDYILKMDRIKDCLVIVNMPKESSFVLSSNEKQASASVLVEIKGGGTLTGSEANAIAETVAMGVPGLKKENIRIVDTNMHLYSLDEDELSNSTSSVDRQFALEKQLQEKLEQQIVNLLSPVYGMSNIKVAARVTLNFDSEIVSKVEFSPPVEGETDGIVVSMSELYENSRTGAGGGGIPGTDTNGLGTVEYPYTEPEDGELYNKVLREANYEINETRTQIEKAKGTIDDLSIAILIDSQVIEEDYTDSVENLVAKAIGVDGDFISVERLPFRNADDEMEARLAEQEKFMRALQTREIIMEILKYAILLTIVLLAFSLIKSIVKIAVAGKQEEMLLASGKTVEFIADDEMDEKYPDVELSAKPEEIEQLERFIDKDPEAVAQLLRNWLSDD